MTSLVAEGSDNGAVRAKLLDVFLQIQAKVGRPSASFQALSAQAKASLAPVEQVTPNKRPPVPDKALPPAPAQPTRAFPTELRGRINVVDEIVSTERDYLGSLRKVQDRFLTPLTALLADIDIKDIFSNLPQIITTNEALLDELERNQRDHDIPVGQILSKFSDFLKIYTVYCANQGTMYATIARLKDDNPEFAGFMLRAERTSGGVIVELSQYLLMPTQRICRYPLLIKELVRNTPALHPDASALAEADRKLGEIAQHVNEGKRPEETLQKIREVQAALRNSGGLSPVDRKKLSAETPPHCSLLDATSGAPLPKRAAPKRPPKVLLCLSPQVVLGDSMDQELLALAEAGPPEAAVEEVQQAQGQRLEEQRRKAHVARLEAKRRGDAAREVEEARRAEEVRREEALLAERRREEERRAQEARREEERKAQEARLEEARRRAEEERRADETRRVEAARRAEEARRADVARAEEARAQEARRIEEQKKQQAEASALTTARAELIVCRDCGHTWSMMETFSPFCAECGTPVAPVANAAPASTPQDRCRECGAARSALETYSPFCSECGANVSASQPAAGASLAEFDYRAWITLGDQQFQVDLVIDESSLVWLNVDYGIYEEFPVSAIQRFAVDGDTVTLDLGKLFEGPAVFFSESASAIEAKLLAVVGEVPDSVRLVTCSACGHTFDNAVDELLYCAECGHAVTEDSTPSLYTCTSCGLQW